MFIVRNCDEGILTQGGKWRRDTRGDLWRTEFWRIYILMIFDAVNFDADELWRSKFWRRWIVHVIWRNFWGVNWRRWNVHVIWRNFWGVNWRNFWGVNWHRILFACISIYNLQFVSVYVKFKVYATFSTSILPFSLWTNLIVLAENIFRDILFLFVNCLSCFGTPISCFLNSLSCFRMTYSDLSIISIQYFVLYMWSLKYMQHLFCTNRTSILISNILSWFGTSFPDLEFPILISITLFRK